MSRTYRKPNHNWYNTNINDPEDWHYFNGILIEIKDCTPKQISIIKAALQSDKLCGMGTPPAWFRKELEAEKRAKDKAEIKRINVQGDHDEYSFNPRKDDVAWEWW